MSAPCCNNHCKQVKCPFAAHQCTAVCPIPDPCKIPTDSADLKCCWSSLALLTSDLGCQQTELSCDIVGLAYCLVLTMADFVSCCTSKCSKAGFPWRRAARVSVSPSLAAFSHCFPCWLPTGGAPCMLHVHSKWSTARAVTGPVTQHMPAVPYNISRQVKSALADLPACSKAVQERT